MCFFAKKNIICFYLLPIWLLLSINLSCTKKKKLKYSNYLVFINLFSGQMQCHMSFYSYTESIFNCTISTYTLFNLSSVVGGRIVRRGVGIRQVYRKFNGGGGVTCSCCLTFGQMKFGCRRLRFSSWTEYNVI